MTRTEAERSEVSTHELAVVAALRAGGWHTNKALAASTGVAERTVRLHTLRLVALGVVDVAEVYPGHRFRWSEMAKTRNRAYVGRLAQAAEAFA